MSPQQEIFFLYSEKTMFKLFLLHLRPLKGLLVINVFPYFLKEVVCCGFPSPTGATYYE